MEALISSLAGNLGYTLHRLNEHAKDRKTILLITTGGTIAGQAKAGSTENYSIGELEGEALAASVPGMEKLANLYLLPFCNKGSCDIKTEDWLELSRMLNAFAKEEAIDGFVLTHGTDTMEETAYWLNLSVKTEKPVVLTGAMRPATALSADGPMNLYQAVLLAASKEAWGQEVMAVFSGGIYGARSLNKCRINTPAAMHGGDSGQIGWFCGEQARFYSRSTRLCKAAAEFFTDELETLPKVSIAYFSVDADTMLLDYMLEHSEGLIVAGPGSANMSLPWIERIGKMEGKGYPVVRATRNLEGAVFYQHKYDRFSHVIRCDNLPPHKARILLQLALTQTKDPEKIRKIFETY